MAEYKSRKTNRKAIISLILGVLSIFLLFAFLRLNLIVAVIGLASGILGLKEMEINDEDGKKTAIAGISCSGVGIIVGSVMLVFALLG